MNQIANNKIVQSLSSFSNLFDKINIFWGNKNSLKIISAIIVFSFLSTLFLIQLKIWGILPQFLHIIIPSNHFFAIEIAFTFLLIVEIIGMIFILPQSVSAAMAKQFEIFSLILLRHAFKDFGEFSEPFIWNENIDQIIKMLSDAFGALLIFAAIVLFKQIQRHVHITKDENEQSGFIHVKKILAVFMIFGFAISGFYAAFSNLFFLTEIHFFKSFYTILIFTDVLIVLISLRYSHLYIIVFRNSGFALATVIIRLALTVPAFYNVVLGIFAAIFILGLSFTYNKFVELRLNDE